MKGSCFCLQELQKNSPRTYSYDAALADENKIKNRYVNIVPCKRICLLINFLLEITAGVFQEMQFVKNRLHSMVSMVMGNRWKEKNKKKQLVVHVMSCLLVFMISNQ